jgi:copper chaperone CopZ
MTQTKSYFVPDISSGHCSAAIAAEIGTVAGVDSVDVHLEETLVVVTGDGLDDAAIRAAIHEAGYRAIESSELPERELDVVVIGAGHGVLNEVTRRAEHVDYDQPPRSAFPIELPRKPIADSKGRK